MRNLFQFSNSLIKPFPDFYSMTGIAQAGVCANLIFGKTIPFSVSHWTKVTVPNVPATNDGGSIVGIMDNSLGWGWDTYNSAAINGDTGLGYQPRLSFSDLNAASVVGVETTKILSDGGWHHTVVTYNGANSGTPTNDILFWLDNVSQSTQNNHDNSIIGNWNTSTNSFNLKARNNNGGALIHSFNGKLDLVSLFNIQLNATQVRELYNARTPVDVRTLPFYANCVAFYPIGEGTDTVSTITDLKNGYNATGSGVVLLADVP